MRYPRPGKGAMKPGGPTEQAMQQKGSLNGDVNIAKNVGQDPCAKALNDWRSHYDDYVTAFHAFTDGKIDCFTLTLRFNAHLPAKAR